MGSSISLFCAILKPKIATKEHKEGSIIFILMCIGDTETADSSYLRVHNAMYLPPQVAKGPKNMALKRPLLGLFKAESHHQQNQGGIQSHQGPLYVYRRRRYSRFYLSPRPKFHVPTYLIRQKT